MDFTNPNVSPTYFGSHAINDTNYQTKIARNTPLVPETEAIYVERFDEFPVYSGIKYSDRTIPLNVVIVSGGTGTTDQLKGWFDTTRGYEERFVVYDSSSSTSWYVMASAKSITKEGASLHRVTLGVSDPIWRNNTASTASWSGTASGGTISIAVGGTKYALPTFTITPTDARTGGYAYKRWVAIYNTAATKLTNYPMNILGGDVDHAALVLAGKAQADGDDFRVFVDGSEVTNKWVGGGGYNSTTLRVFTNVSLPAKIEMTLLTPIASSGAIQNIFFDVTPANSRALAELAKQPNKVLYIGTEAFTFESVRELAFAVDGVQRAAKYTSEAAHNYGDTVRHIPIDVWVAYGDATVSAPAAADDNLKPMLDLANSTNSSWVYTDYYRRQTLRTAQFEPRVVTSKWASVSTTPTAPYGANQATNYTFDVIASEMGASIKANYYLNVWRAEAAEVDWGIYIPTGITTVSASGEKYRVSTSWANIAGLQASSPFGDWATIWSEATPTTAGSWTSFSHATASLGGTFERIRFVLSGSVGAVANNAIHMEIDAVTLAIANAPGVTLGAETSDYYMNITLDNITTGESITVTYPGSLNTPVTVNCETKSVVFSDGTNIRGAVVLDSIRKEWMRLEPGTNNIVVTETGMAGVTVAWSYEERSL